MGQIPRSTERISSCLVNTTERLKHEEIGKFLLIAIIRTKSTPYKMTTFFSDST